MRPIAPRWNIGAPTVILAKTVKGYGLGEAGEGRNITHQQKKLNEKELREFRARFEHPDQRRGDCRHAVLSAARPTVRKPSYLRERRKALGGFLPAASCDGGAAGGSHARTVWGVSAGSERFEVSTTMAFVRLLGSLLRNKQIGRHIVPIIPDEARTFGMDALFREVGIYSSKGQLYEPVDRESLLYYHESQGRSDPRGGHHRGRCDVVVHRGRDGVRDHGGQHDSRSTSTTRCSVSSGSAT